MREDIAMRILKIILYSGIFLLIASIFYGCVTSGSGSGSSGVYHPVIQPGKTVNEAINDLLYLVGTEYAVEWNKKCGQATAQNGTILTIVKSAIENNRFILTYRVNNVDGIRTMYLNLSDLVDYNVVVEDKYIPIPTGIKLRCNHDIAKKIADALYMIKWYLENSRDEFNRKLEDFAPVAAEYREFEIKPRITEEQRKLIVQANKLTEQKQYGEAVSKYLQAIELDPVSSPESYFNLALLEAQINIPYAAIAYMKQYLMLVPDAADSRSAQDKIYEWELLMPKTQATAGVARHERGYLGVRFEEPSQGQTVSGEQIIKGAMVIEVMPGSPAEKGGLMAGDIIHSFDGYKVEKSAALLSMVAATKVGKIVDVGIRRDGKDRVIKITIDKRP